MLVKFWMENLVEDTVVLLLGNLSTSSTTAVYSLALSSHSLSCTFGLHTKLGWQGQASLVPQFWEVQNQQTRLMLTSLGQLGQNQWKSPATTKTLITCTECRCTTTLIHLLFWITILALVQFLRNYCWYLFISFQSTSRVTLWLICCSVMKRPDGLGSVCFCHRSKLNRNAAISFYAPYFRNKLPENVQVF